MAAIVQPESVLALRAGPTRLAPTKSKSLKIKCSLHPHRGARQAVPQSKSFASSNLSTVTRKAQDSWRCEASKQTFTTFEEMVTVSDTVLVDFYAVWCGPCQLMNNVLNDVSKKAGDNLRIVKVDTEKYPVLASQYKVEALPTFILFHKGQQVDRVEGAMTADKLLARIDSAVAAATKA